MYIKPWPNNNNENKKIKMIIYEKNTDMIINTYHDLGVLSGSYSHVYLVTAMYTTAAAIWIPIQSVTVVTLGLCVLVFHLDPVPITARHRIRVMRLLASHAAVRRSRWVDLFISVTQRVKQSWGILNHWMVGCDLGSCGGDRKVVCAPFWLCVCVNAEFLKEMWARRPSHLSPGVEVTSVHHLLTKWLTHFVAPGPTSGHYQRPDEGCMPFLFLLRYQKGSDFRMIDDENFVICSPSFHRRVCPFLIVFPSTVQGKSKPWTGECEGWVVFRPTNCLRCFVSTFFSIREKI